MSDVLAGIAAYKRIEVDTRKAATSQDASEALARLASPPRSPHLWQPTSIRLAAETTP